MIFDIECESQAGQKPKRFVTENQDAFSIKKTDQWCCLCVADGAGSKRYSSKGAKWLVQDLCDYLIENASNLFEQNEEQIRKLVMSCIRQSLFKTARHQNVAVSELSSTLLCVLTDGVNCLLLHLGDGVILAVREGYLNVLSFPMNGNSKRSTALTTMTTAEQHLRIQKVLCDSINIVWLMTDGAMYTVFQENYGLNGDKLSMPMIRQKLSDGNEDDATYGYIKWRN